MPSHSRTRDRNYQRDRERDTDNEDNYYHSRHRRLNKDERRFYDEQDHDDDDYRRQEYRSARRERGQSSRDNGRAHGYYEIEVKEEEEGEGEGEESNRRGKVRHKRHSLQPDEPRTPTTRRVRPVRDRGEEDYSRRTRTRERTPKAKESPATSPKKKLDREGYRRNTSRAPRDGSPLRERRQRHRYEEETDKNARRGPDRVRNRELERDQDREQRRQQRRRDQDRPDRGREYAAAPKHTSTDSANSASQLLSADALARLNEHYEKERMILEAQRGEAYNDEEQEPEEEQGRRERHLSRTRDIMHEEDDDFPQGDGLVQDTIRVEKKRQRRRQPPLHERSETTRNQYKDDDDVDLPFTRRDQKRRLVSGAVMEEGRSHKLFFWRRRGRRNEPVDTADVAHGNDNGGDGGDYSSYSHDFKDPNDDNNRIAFWRRKRTWVIAGVIAAILAIVIPVAVVASRKKSSGAPSSSSSSGSDSSSSSYGAYNSSLSTISEDSIPASAKGTYLDPFTWYDTRDFNLTYTNETVGGLPIMGLNSTWDDSAQPNSNVPRLNETFPYGARPIRGVNLGGWLSIEPFITPSFFSSYSIVDGVVDEYTLSQKLGPDAASTIEQHYTTFIQEEDFAEIAAAGLDHVRIQYSYWAVTTYDGDPYVKQISWRYLLRAIEYCRKYGLRVNLDLHGLPGSQNGYNHSGRQGQIGWLNGTDGMLNGQRAIDIHNQLSQFFAQPRYKNIIAIYGLANEPLMLELNISTVLDWTINATEVVQANGIKAKIAMGDGFLNLDKWEYMMKDNAPSNLLLDTHQYTIFNVNEIDLNHTAKISLICDAWLPMIQKVNSTSQGWGPTISGEFSQSDTDCTTYLNNVNSGTRWEGTLGGSTTPDCFLKSDACSCNNANAAVTSYSDEYKLWLQTYAEAQFSAFETALGWFYWTWNTESAPQWSYKQARAGGFMPQLAYEPNFTCSDSVPSFGNLPEFY